MPQQRWPWQQCQLKVFFSFLFRFYKVAETWPTIETLPFVAKLRLCQRVNVSSTNWVFWNIKKLSSDSMVARKIPSEPSHKDRASKLS